MKRNKTLTGIFALAGISVILSPSAIAEKQIGAFTYEESTDAMTDAYQGFAHTQSVDNPEMVLAVRCRGDSKDLYVTHSYMIGDEGRSQVMYRFDEKEPSEYETWDLSTDNRASFLKVYKMERIAQGAIKSNRVIFRVQDPHDGETNTGTFELNGFTRVINRLRCFDY